MSDSCRMAAYQLQRLDRLAPPARGTKASMKRRIACMHPSQFCRTITGPRPQLRDETEVRVKSAHLPITRPTRSLRANQSTPVSRARIGADDNRSGAGATQARSPWTRNYEHGLWLVYRRGLPASSGRRKRAQQPWLHGHDASCGWQLKSKLRVGGNGQCMRLLNNHHLARVWSPTPFGNLRLSAQATSAA